MALEFQYQTVLLRFQNNYLYSESNGVYGIATYMSENISINNNAFDIISGNLSNVEYDLDVIKPGNAAIYLASKNDLINIEKLLSIR